MHSRRARALNLTVLVLALSVPISLLDGPPFWSGLALLMLATVVATGALAPERPSHGLPLAPRIMPALAAFTTAGLAHLAGVDPVWLVALAIGATLTAATLVAEQRLVGPADERRAHLERQLLPLAIVLAFGAFAAASGAVESGFATPAGEAAAGTSSADLGASALLALALAEAAVAAALGYRLAALRTTSLPEALRIAGTYAVVTGVTAALLRAVDLPRLFGPAVLAGVFYLWSAYRDASAAQRRTSAWLLEYGLLVLALGLVVGWNLLVR